MDCPFCKKEDIDPKIIYRNELVFSFPTNIPITCGHTLICPLRHVSKIDELTSEETEAINRLIIKSKIALKECFGAEGFNIAWNEGLTAGQSINHLHIHLVPRKSGDQGIYKYDPREFLYRPGSREKSPEAELVSIAGSIKKFIK